MFPNIVSVLMSSAPGLPLIISQLNAVAGETRTALLALLCTIAASQEKDLTEQLRYLILWPICSRR